MMFEHSFEMGKAAELIIGSIEKTLKQGYRTADIAQKGDKVVTTQELTKTIINNFDVIYNEQALGVFTL